MQQEKRRLFLEARSATSMASCEMILTDQETPHNHQLAHLLRRLLRFTHASLISPSSFPGDILRDLTHPHDRITSPR